MTAQNMHFNKVTSGIRRDFNNFNILKKYLYILWYL